MSLLGPTVSSIEVHLLSLESFNSLIFGLNVHSVLLDSFFDMEKFPQKTVNDHIVLSNSAAT